MARIRSVLGPHALPWKVGVGVGVGHWCWALVLGVGGRRSVVGVAGRACKVR